MKTFAFLRSSAPTPTDDPFALKAVPAVEAAPELVYTRESLTSKSATAYRTISEVAEELGVATHVLRFWEGKFKDLKPMKRQAGRRFYRPQDVALLRRIKTLLYDEGYTIKGVQVYLKKNKGEAIATELTEVLTNRQLAQELRSIRELLAS
ncbi:MAG: MerR family transcriptional regulator [Alphaproteobacteria bacterium]